MELNWLQGLLMGLFSGLTDILPVSAQAHRLLILKLLGESGEPLLLRLMIHLATLAALYWGCRSHIIRISRATKLARIPKRRRKRPLDRRSLMDFSLLKTTLIPLIIGFLFYRKTSSLAGNLIIVAVCLFVNGIILYIPQFLPGSNKHSGNLTRVEGILLGLGGAVSTVPGISCVGSVVSVGRVCGLDKSYALNMALLINIPYTIGLILFDFLAIFNGGMGSMSFGAVFACMLAAAGAFAGVFLGIKLLRKIISSVDFSIFGFYCWGAALFTFILYLTAA